MKNILLWLQASIVNKIIFGVGITAVLASAGVGTVMGYRALQPKHEHTIAYQYESNDDGTHNKVSYCTKKDGLKCEDFKSETVKEACKFDKEKVCKCGYKNYVVVKFLNNVDGSVIKEIHVDRGTTLDQEKDFPEIPEIEGYKFVQIEGAWEDIQFDQEIIYTYEKINEDLSEENTTTSSNNSSNSSNRQNGSSNNSSGSSSQNNWGGWTPPDDSIYDFASMSDEEFGALISSGKLAGSIRADEELNKRHVNNLTKAMHLPEVDAFYYEHGVGGFSMDDIDGMGGTWYMHLTGADGAKLDVLYPYYF